MQIVGGVCLKQWNGLFNFMNMSSLCCCSYIRESNNLEFFWRGLNSFFLFKTYLGTCLHNGINILKYNKG